MIKNKLFIFFVTFLLLSCKDNVTSSKAKIKSDALLEKIATGDASDDFPGKYFPPQQTMAILGLLKDSCDFKSRQGNFINDFYGLNMGKANSVAFIYEFYLRCDSLRFV